MSLFIQTMIEYGCCACGCILFIRRGVCMDVDLCLVFLGLCQTLSLSSLSFSLSLSRSLSLSLSLSV